MFTSKIMALKGTSTSRRSSPAPDCLGETQCWFRPPSARKNRAVSRHPPRRRVSRSQTANLKDAERSIIVPICILKLLVRLSVSNMFGASRVAYLFSFVSFTGDKSPRNAEGVKALPRRRLKNIFLNKLLVFARQRKMKYYFVTININELNSPGK